MNNIFQTYTTKQKFMAVNQRWTFEKILPIPLFDFTCPICGSNKIKLGEWIFFRKKTSGETPFRCDVRFKCCECSFVPIFGVIVPDIIMKQLPISKHSFTWYEGEQILNGTKKISDFKNPIIDGD